MATRDEHEVELSTEKARTMFFLEGWRTQLLLHQHLGDAEGIELDRRILDYYLDLYREVECPAARALPEVA